MMKEKTNEKKQKSELEGETLLKSDATTKMADDGREKEKKSKRNKNNSESKDPKAKQQKQDDNKHSFAACLIFMDDTHLLPEWLAYHYQMLPLRRLIVAIDPKSVTSPTAILDRYHSRNLIDVTIWHDDDYYHDKQSMTASFMHRQNTTDDKDVAKSVYLWRQQRFYKACMETLRDEGRSWVAMIDTDEYITRNPYVTHEQALVNVHPTIIDMLDDASNRHNDTWLHSRPCVPMSRPEYIGYDGADMAKVIDDDDDDAMSDGVRQSLPNTNNAIRSLHKSTQYSIRRGEEEEEEEERGSLNVMHDLLTYRWRSMHNILRPGKCMIDLSRIGDVDIRVGEVNPHMPIAQLCSKSHLWLYRHESAFVTNHYTGTYDQWTFRDDHRGDRTRQVWQEMIDDVNGNSNGQHRRDGDDHPMLLWLPRFVSSVGRSMALSLLVDAGDLSRYQKMMKEKKKRKQNK